MRDILAKIITLFAVFTGLFLFSERTFASDNDVNDKKIQHSQSADLKAVHLTVMLERNYLDGEVSEEAIKETVASMDDFWAKYKDWQLVGMGENRIFLQRKMNDISPLLKANGFFGVTGNGVLTIFNGRPDHSKVIQSFFQLDMKKLESSKAEELLQGIPIKTKDRYVEVITSFKQYSVKPKN